MKTLTYLVNLSESHQRLESATQQLKRIDWPFERYEAYDGRGIALSEFKNYDDQLANNILGRSLLSSEIGCYLSHYGCAVKFLQTDADFLIVLEDDMKISDSFATTINNTLAFLYSNQQIDWYLINIAAKKKKLASNITIINHHTLWHAYYFPIRGLGLIWSRKGAEEFVKNGEIIAMPVDIFFQRWLSNNGKGLAVWPALVQPLGLDSDILGTISAQKINRKDKENRDLLYSIKKQKRMWQDKSSAIKHLYSNK